MNEPECLSTVISGHSSCPCLTFMFSNKTVSTIEPVDLEYTMNLAGMEGRVERLIYVSLERSSSKKNQPPPAKTLRATFPYIPSKKNTIRLQTASGAPELPEASTLTITPDTRAIILTIVGDATPSAYLKPVSANFGIITPDKISLASRHATLRGNNKNAYIISISQSAETLFRTTLDSDKKGFSVFLAKDAQPGLHVETLTVRTTDSDVPEMPFYLYAHILGDIEVLPNAIEISRSQEKASAMILVRPLGNTAPTSFRILSAETVPNLGDTRVRALPDSSWRVSLSGIPTTDVLPRSFLLLKTNSTISPEIKIPIQFKD